VGSVASRHKEALGIANGKVVSKYSDHLPLCRQAQIYARQGIDLWIGRRRPAFDVDVPTGEASRVGRIRLGD
jgi:transposase